jgi:hypothetical protein
MNDRDIRRAQGTRLRAARKAAGYRSAREAAISNGWPPSTYSAHERGDRTIGADDAEKYLRRFRAQKPGLHVNPGEILFGPNGGATPIPRKGSVASGGTSGNPRVSIMGYIGAGAEILPEFEQVPEEGLEDVDLPFAVDGDLVAFEIRGESMMPRYDDGDVILVRREMMAPFDAFLGREAAVLTTLGRRYLKNIEAGEKPRTFTLTSWNARPIKNVQLRWVGEIVLTVRANALRKLRRQSGRVAASRPPGS